MVVVLPTGVPEPSCPPGWGHTRATMRKYHVHVSECLNHMGEGEYRLVVSREPLSTYVIYMVAGWFCVLRLGCTRVLHTPLALSERYTEEYAFVLEPVAADFRRWRVGTTSTTRRCRWPGRRAVSGDDGIVSGTRAANTARRRLSTESDLCVRGWLDRTIRVRLGALDRDDVADHHAIPGKQDRWQLQEIAGINAVI